MNRPPPPPSADLSGDTEDIPALPLWLNGHAYLKLTPSFQGVRNPASGQWIRRIPVCGTEEIGEAIESARAAAPAWKRLDANERQRRLTDLGDALERYAEHFARLIVDESGKEKTAADDEIAATIAILRTAKGKTTAHIAVAPGHAQEPLLSALRPAASALASGVTLIVCPALQTPSPLLALAELASRCGIPPGVMNVIYPNAGDLEKLGDDTEIELLR